jgi:hypothetical protein
MKRLVIIFCFWILYAPLYGQHIVRAEYFTDTDPGYGKGTPVAITDGPDTEMSFSIPLGDFGLHTLYVRVKDSEGVWSQTLRRVYMVQPLPLDPGFLIDRIEYFIEEDPGFGQGIPIDFQEGVHVEAAITIPLHTLEKGVHTLYVRARDNTGRWGMQFYRTFLMQVIPQNEEHSISYIEYFFDQDPGFGKGTPIGFQAGGEIVVSAELPLEGLTDGMHTLYVRARDDKDGWSMVFYQTFVKLTAPAYAARVVRMEYFVNTDPGAGKGTAVNLNTPRTHVMKYFVVDPELVQPGKNVLYVRALDSHGRWSMVYHTEFLVLEAEPCDPPTDLLATEVTETTADLAWAEQGAVDSRDLIWVPADSDFTEDGMLETGLSQSNFELEGLEQSTPYEFYVRIACADGQMSPWAGPASFHTLPLPNQIELLQEQEQVLIKVYPNPASGRLWVEFENQPGSTAELWLTNMMGQVVLRQSVSDPGSTKLYLDVADLTPGVYLLGLKSGPHYTARKLMINP